MHPCLLEWQADPNIKETYQQMMHILKVKIVKIKLKVLKRKNVMIIFLKNAFIGMSIIVTATCVKS